MFLWILCGVSCKFFITTRNCHLSVTLNDLHVQQLPMLATDSTVWLNFEVNSCTVIPLVLIDPWIWAIQKPAQSSIRIQLKLFYLGLSFVNNCSLLSHVIHVNIHAFLLLAFARFITRYSGQEKFWCAIAIHLNLL